nr:indolepyruvate oxidoreductase subunit beta [Maliibacterium massiliense]
METLNILIVGVGGQGTLLASRIMGALAMKNHLDVKLSEVHGMAQRGGSVETHVRIGDQVHAPLVRVGTADVVLAFEPLEAARWAHYLKNDGMILTNSQRIWPMPVISGVMPYPEDLAAQMDARGMRCVDFDALTLAKEAGSQRAVNMVLLGALSVRLPFAAEQWLEVIEEIVPPKTLAANQKAFMLGRAAASN